MLGLGNLESFFLISDSHVGNSAVGMEDFVIALRNMKKINKETNLFHLGDLTNYGDSIYMANCLTEISYFFPEAIITLGNHDVRGRKNGLAEKVDNDGWIDFWKVFWDSKKDTLNDPRFNSFNQVKSIFFSCNKKTFGEYEYDNCLIFSLCTERPIKDSCYLTKNQLDSLEKTIEKSKKEKKIVFILSHQALNNTHIGSNDFHGFGPQNDQVEAILNKGKNIVFFSGHIHNGIGKNQIIKKNFGFLVDTPSFCYPESGLMEKGVGYYITLEENNIKIEPYFFGNIVNEIYKKLEEYIISITL
ncbi:metallophosphoesterase family protein [Enterococcus faecalis]|uniref:metallophosphoesterase family protein n=1 Tax=Enterococcus faecalis TaxID=1351 RepID=UPI0001F0D177|nr:metallophosphoesterase [Enterococcus faecalis]EFT95513.1 Ser/Thr phosphatase family protein [Enterococcus faecalis TX0012]